MQKFYIFLDIAGVLWDWSFLKNNNLTVGGTITTFNPESMKALNYLISKLNSIYNTYLVISSTWRRDMLHTVKVLKDNGLKMNLLKIRETSISKTPEKRGKEIKSFLNMFNETSNYLIIDDEMFDFKNLFSNDKIIKTNIFNNSLNMTMVEKALNNILINNRSK